MDDLDGFFAALGHDEALAAESILREIADEVRGHGFEYKEEQALDHGAALLVARGWHHGFVEHAARMGSRAWKPILTMAESAWKEGKRDLALQVFAAADQPGMHRDNLRRYCVELTGALPPPRRAILTAVP